MNILTAWLRTYLPSLPVSDRELADDLTLRGIAVEGVHDLGLSSTGQPTGHLFEMDITTNRVDAMNHYGIAREAAAIYNLPLAPLTSVFPNRPADTPSSRPEAQPERRDPCISPESPRKPTVPPHPFPIRIDPAAGHLCGRFTAQVLRDVTIAPSAEQVKTFFDLLGQKQISNAVDASNFTLLGMGHPTHAFDLDTIEGGIVIRLAHKGERLKLLDGSERILDPEDLVIADETKPLSLAGVMGGWDSMITPDTRNILVEAAWFDPATIRRSSRRHLLHTDASHRFERGADFNAAPVANRLVSALILQSGHADGDLIDLVDPATEHRTSARAPIILSVREVERRLGLTLDDTPTHSALTAALITRYLTALGCTLTSFESDSSPHQTFSVSLPSWRLDLEREIDLIEEVARVFGYNRFRNTLPTPLPVLVHPTLAPQRAIRSRLLALGFSEALSSTFASVPDSDLFAPTDSTTLPSPAAPSHAALGNPLSEDAANLRPSLMPGMLGMLAGNLNRDVLTARLFEQGQIFQVAPPSRVPHLRDSPIVATVGEAPQNFNSDPAIIEAVLETPSLALGLTTASPEPTSLFPAADAPVFELKGVLESLASLFTLPGGPEALSFSTDHTPAWLEPGRSATAHLGAAVLAHFGELSHAESARRKLRQRVFLATIDLALLYALPLRNVTAHELSRFQAVERDFSFFFADSVHWHTVFAAIHALFIPELTRLAPVEIFRDPKGKAVPPGRHSLLLRATFQSPTHTLTETELTTFWSRIIEALTALGGTLRDF